MARSALPHGGLGRNGGVMMEDFENEEPTLVEKPLTMHELLEDDRQKTTLRMKPIKREES